MKTKVFTDNITGAAEIIRSGGLVAVPTETVYGLAANGLDADAVEKIYEVKGRPAYKPLSLMVHGSEEMERYCLSVPPQAKTLAKRFWPGPLTIVLRARKEIPSVVLAGGDTVGLRCPDHPKTLELLRLTGLPFAAPSANPSGEESPKSAEKVMEYFDGAIDGVIDGGQCGIGRESTLISMAETPYRILRRGALGEEEIADALTGGMTLIGLTGPSGSGKTTALRAIEALGGLSIDCDARASRRRKRTAGSTAKRSARSCFPTPPRLRSSTRSPIASLPRRCSAACAPGRWRAARSPRSTRSS